MFGIPGWVCPFLKGNGGGMDLGKRGNGRGRLGGEEGEETAV